MKKVYTVDVDSPSQDKEEGPSVEPKETEGEEAPKGTAAEGTPDAKTAGEKTPEGAPDVDALRKELEAARAEAAGLKDKWLRAEADMDNYRKRVQREKNEYFLYGHEKLVGDLLPILDNLERAIDHAREMGLDSKILEGVEITRKQFLSVLERSGVVPIESLGKAFDPGVHEAVMEEASSDLPPHTVVRVVERGYMLKDRLLRPTKVVLSKAPVPAAGETAGGEEAPRSEAAEEDHGCD